MHPGTVMIHPRFQFTQSKSTMLSLTIHTCAVALILLLSKQIVPSVNEIRLRANVAPLISPFMPKRSSLSIGGGGGMHQVAPATAGRLPKIAPRQFVPPTLEITNLHPKLAMEMTIEAPPDAALLDRSLPNIGDPLSKLMNGSAGTGGPLGIGNGNGTGLGDKRGPGVGSGDSLTGTIYQAGRGVTAPVPIFTPEPEFSDEARRAKHSGVVILSADVDPTGRPRNLHVKQGLGLGLDEKALETVTRWTFKPGTKDGKAVAVAISVYVYFHLM